MILDDSALKDQEDRKAYVVKGRRGPKVKAEKDYEIAIKQNERAIATAEVGSERRRIALDKLTGVSSDPTRVPLAAAVAGRRRSPRGGSSARNSTT